MAACITDTVRRGHDAQHQMLVFCIGKELILLSKVVLEMLSFRECKARKAAVFLQRVLIKFLAAPPTAGEHPRSTHECASAC